MGYMAALANDILHLGAWLLLLAVIFIPLEKIFALHRQKVSRKWIGLDLAYYFLSGVVPKLLLIAPLTVIAAVVHRLEPMGFIPG